MIILGLFSLVFTKTYVVSIHKKCLIEALLVSTHNKCFCGEIRIIDRYIPP